jgi:hypothetical protein
MLALAAVAALGISTQAQAVGTIDLFSFTGSSSELTLSAVVPGGNQPLNNPCLICGTNQPAQPTGFGYNNFQAQGNINDYFLFSTATVGGSLGNDVLGTGYEVGDGSVLRAYLLSQLDFNGQFAVGIDVNDTGKAQTLESFYFLNLTKMTVLASFSPGVGGVEVPAQNNGTGFPDYTLSGFDINRGDISIGDKVIFFSRWSGANDGAESFFLVAQPGGQGAVPEPATWALMISGFGGAGAMLRRRRAQLLAA